MIESVLLAGGGTAGHVNPLLAVADELRDRDPHTRIAVLGTETGLETELVPARGYELSVIPKVPFPRRPSTDWFAFPGRLRAAIRGARDVIDSHNVQVVIGFGGYVSTPAYIAARQRRIPVVIHEQNARPGLANRLGARWAAVVAVTFPSTPIRGAHVTGLPLRREIVDLLAQRAQDTAATRAAAAARLGLDPNTPTLVVTGGSLGAQSLNEAMVGVLDRIERSPIQVLHLTGRGKSQGIKDAIEARGQGFSARYQVREYLEQMHDALAVADLVLCRSGAGTVAELTALGIPAAYVPLPIGNGEQRLNAKPTVSAGGGLIVEDAALTPQWISQTLLPLVTDPDALARLAAGAALVGRSRGAQEVADLAEEFALKERP